MGFEADLNRRESRRGALVKRSAAVDPETLAAEIADLSKLGIDDLRERWKMHVRSSAHRDLGENCENPSPTRGLKHFQGLGAIPPKTAFLYSHPKYQRALNAARR